MVARAEEPCRVAPEGMAGSVFMKSPEETPCCSMGVEVLGLFLGGFVAVDETGGAVRLGPPECFRILGMFPLGLPP